MRTQNRSTIEGDIISMPYPEWVVWIRAKIKTINPKNRNRLRRSIERKLENGEISVEKYDLIIQLIEDMNARA
jgi:hypothetical protein